MYLTNFDELETVEPVKGFYFLCILTSKLTKQSDSFFIIYKTRQIWKKNRTYTITENNTHIHKTMEITTYIKYVLKVMVHVIQFILICLRISKVLVLLFCSVLWFYTEVRKTSRFYVYCFFANLHNCITFFLHRKDYL